MDDTTQHVTDKLKKDLEDVKSKLQDAEEFLADHTFEEDPNVQKLEEEEEKQKQSSDKDEQKK